MTASSNLQTLPNAEPNQHEAWRIRLLYDGACPLCLREVNFLRRQDRGRGLVTFVDIAAVDYDPVANGGVDFATAMGRIHAIRADGQVIKNVEVFRQVYQVLGMGWVYAATRWPVIGPLVDWLYDFWADRRLAWTGRPDLATLLTEREQGCGEANRCRLE
jgi:predicted DCC family thiol-disulfide oxidoreductase YuxK